MIIESSEINSAVHQPLVVDVDAPPAGNALADQPVDKQIILRNIKFLEEFKKQKLAIIDKCEEQIEKLEETYLQNSLRKHGNVFNGWKEIQKNARFNAPNKRMKKQNEKLKESEKIYVPQI